MSAGLVALVETSVRMLASSPSTFVRATSRAAMSSLSCFSSLVTTRPAAVSADPFFPSAAALAAMAGFCISELVAPTFWIAAITEAISASLMRLMFIST